LTAAFELLFTDSAIRKSLLLSHPDLFGNNIKADSTNSLTSTRMNNGLRIT
jgi:hypothetical protein